MHVDWALNDMRESGILEGQEVIMVLRLCGGLAGVESPYPLEYLRIK